MHLLSKNGRTALLTFLRNLTPQALLLSVGLLLYVRWRTSHVALDAVLAGSVFVVLVMAIVANLDEFLENAFSQSNEIAAHLGAVKEQEPSVLKRIWRVLRFIGKEKPVTLVELVVAFFVIYMAVLAVLHSAVQAVARSVG
jgi:hypothetical protein